MQRFGLRGGRDVLYSQSGGLFHRAGSPRLRAGGFQRTRLALRVGETMPAVVAVGYPAETRPGLVTPHAAGLALITPLAGDAIANLQTISSTFACAYDASYGFRDAVMTWPGAPDYGQCSARFSALAQEWLFLGLVNRESGFIWRYFYRHPGVFQAHLEMYGGGRVYLPLVMRAGGNMGRETGHWPGIEFLPDDIQMCDEVTITRAP